MKTIEAYAMLRMEAGEGEWLDLETVRETPHATKIAADAHDQREAGWASIYRPVRIAKITITVE